jgi:hypothetical protein
MQKPAKASVVRQSIAIVRAVTADFFFDCRASEVLSDE